MRQDEKSPKKSKKVQILCDAYATRMRAYARKMFVLFSTFFAILDSPKLFRKNLLR